MPLQQFRLQFRSHDDLHRTDVKRIATVINNGNPAFVLKEA